MNQRTDSAHTPLNRFRLPSVLVKSTSLIGVFSLLSGNLALAQTETPDLVVPSTTQASKTVTLGTSNKTQSAAPIGIERLRQQLRPAAVSVKQTQPRAKVSSPAAQLSVPQVRSALQPATKLPSVVPARPNQIVGTKVNPAINHNGAYIDPTGYSIGATTAYEAPSSVVLSERSTGCRAVLRQGQSLSGGRCGTTLQRRTRVAVKGIRSQTPMARKSRGVAVAAVSPVRVGPISIDGNGFSATDSTKYLKKFQPIGKPGSVTAGLLFPLTVPAPITSLFGWRVHPITGDRRFHTGTDFGAPLGTPVLAANKGDVAYASFLGGYGLTVVLDHNKFTQQTLYGHLSEVFVQPGEVVEQGTVIGRVGSTGNSTGPHLHFETRQLTPEGWVASDPGTQIKYALNQIVDALRIAQSKQQPGNRS